ncbi:MAG: 5-formyltetrahydrofolate cyclo-ligase [Chromatiales bacterium]|nr:5-formyltetrahydrofolate cyclo-ligase [Chromatiales bacterium]
MRRDLRQQRRDLTSAQQRRHAHAAANLLTRLPQFASSRRLAIYLQNDGELDTGPIAVMAWQRGKSCYLPVLRPGRQSRLSFALYTPDGALRPNRFGIPEPLGTRLHAPRQIDLVLVPLVAFDLNGNRLGMGGGFYDRTFAYRRRGGMGKPLLIGLAHDLQGVRSLRRYPWDVPLDGIVTERAWYPTPRR